MGKVSPQLPVHRRNSIFKRQLNKICDEYSTYLIVSYTLEIFEGNVLTNGGNTKRTMLIFFFPHYIATVGLHRFAKIIVWKNLFIIWFTMDASGSIPRILTLHILNTVDKIRSPVSLTLPQILADS